MWRTDTIWIDLSAFLLMLLVGHIVFGHFEDYKPLWRRLLKVALSLGLFIGLWLVFGRWWTWVILGVPVAVGLVVVHGWYLPKHGINGWTGEPREKYLELVSRRNRRRI
jgi:hypothetical protein